MPSPELVGEGGGEGEVGEQVDCAAKEERGVLKQELRKGAGMKPAHHSCASPGACPWREWRGGRHQFVHSTHQYCSTRYTHE